MSNTEEPIIEMPKSIIIHNGCVEPCDTINGVCVCGSWHTIEDIVSRAWDDGFKKGKETD